ncbi:MAG: hypothetical protein HOW73_24125 [Polyangiaceae bacterium]|nr:hypothetical protein [Polyangiaceae bacterium]
MRARALGWSGERNGLSPAQASELAALMDAIHNIPHLLQRWESCDEEALRATLEAFDAKFSERGRGLVAIYDGVSGGAG